MHYAAVVPCAKYYRDCTQVANGQLGAPSHCFTKVLSRMLSVIPIEITTISHLFRYRFGD
jgi:hypothetical protein